MVKRAVCVGCNYPSKPYGLAGSVNDAFLIAEHLEEHLGFAKENVSVLHDVLPGKRKTAQVEEEKRPTRVNILQKLQWLVRSTKPGDVCFFSFSGYGLQVDDVDTMPDEGLDEAILPTDYQDHNDLTVIVGTEIHDLLAGVPPNSSVTILMDCDHATSIADVSGTLSGELIAGLKETAYCGMKAHSAKVEAATHRRETWLDESSRQAKARPRFQPTMEVMNPTHGRFPTRPAMSRANPVAFCFSAAGHQQTALEMQVTVSEGSWSKGEEKKQHGILSWCFVQALRALRNDCTYLELLQEIQRLFRQKKKELPRMDQETLLTFTPPLSEPTKMKVLQPLQAKAAPRPSGSLTVAPAVVPPPPPGVIGPTQPPLPASPGPLRERTSPSSPPRFTSVPVEPPSKPTPSRFVLGGRGGEAQQLTPNKSVTSVLALSDLFGWPSLTNWFSYEPPKAQAKPSPSPLRSREYEGRGGPSPLRTELRSLSPPFQYRPVPELTSFVALPKPQSYAPVNLLEQNVFTNWRPLEPQWQRPPPTPLTRWRVEPPVYPVHPNSNSRPYRPVQPMVEQYWPRAQATRVVRRTMAESLRDGRALHCRGSAAVQ